MMQRRSICFLIFCAAAALPALANPARYDITPDQVALAVTNRGMQVSPDRVVLLTEVVASVATPELRVKSIDRMGPARAIARLECADSEQCLPFVVAIRLTQDNSRNFVSTASTFPAANARTKAAPIVVRAGSPALLLLNGAHVQISLGVICLDNGAPGQIVHATDRDRRQVYTARVTEDGILEGRL